MPERPLSGRAALVTGDIATAAGDDDYLAERAAHPLRRVTPLHRRGRPEEIAAVVGFLCTDDAGFVTGSSVVADGGLIAY